MSANTLPDRESIVIAYLDEINEKLESLALDESAEPLNRARRRYECELAAIRTARRTANLNPRFASIIAASPLTRPMLAADDPGFGNPQDMRLEALPAGSDW
jgi:hypothetical protein